MTNGDEDAPRRTLAEWPKPTNGLIVAVVTVVIIRLAFLPAGDRFQTVPTGDLDTLVFGKAEAAYRLAGRPSPEYIVFGTSRLFQFEARRLARELSVPPGKIHCLPLLPATFWTFAEFLERNPDLVRNARVIVFDSLPSLLYESPDLFLRPTTVFLRGASLKERLLVADISDRVLAAADWFFPAWSLRAEPVGWRVFVQQLGMNERDRLMDFSTPGLAASVAATPAVMPKGGANYIIRNHAPPPRDEPLRERGLREILRRAPTDCRIVFAVLPLRSDFVAAIGQNGETRESFSAFRRAIEGLGDPRVSVKWHDEDYGVAFTDHDFSDPDHFSVVAIQTKLVGAIANVIRSAMAPERPGHLASLEPRRHTPTRLRLAKAPAERMAGPCLG